jgi:hypothetical protein
MAGVARPVAEPSRLMGVALAAGDSLPPCGMLLSSQLLSERRHACALLVAYSSYVLSDALLSA